MFINSVLVKYSEIVERPEALFDVSNLTNNFQEFIKVGKKPSNNVCSKPPFKKTWYEFYLNFKNNIKVKYGVFLDYNNKRLIAIVFESSSSPELLGKIETETTNCIFNDDTESLVSFPETNKFINKSYKVAVDIIFLLLEVVKYANALLNCKNVRTESHSFPLRRSREHYKRIGKPYFEKYYTLKVKLHGNNKNEPGDGGGWSNSFHICRGHFKIYTNERPLFGQHTGTYWWESTIRGNTDVGVIDKDYKIIP